MHSHLQSRCSTLTKILMIIIPASTSPYYSGLRNYSGDSSYNADLSYTANPYTLPQLPTNHHCI